MRGYVVSQEWGWDSRREVCVKCSLTFCCAFKCAPSRSTATNGISARLTPLHIHVCNVQPHAHSLNGGEGKAGRRAPSNETLPSYMQAELSTSGPKYTHHHCHDSHGHGRNATGDRGKKKVTGHTAAQQDVRLDALPARPKSDPATGRNENKTAALPIIQHVCRDTAGC